MDNLIKILGVLDKPYHYLMIGLFLIGWEYFSRSNKDLYFYGGIFISIALASFIEKILKKKQEDANHEALMKFYDDKINKRK